VAGVRRYEDLIAWQLSFKLQREVMAITATGPAASDLKFRDQLRDAASSPCRNIAEGFGRFAPREFARFLVIARGSLTETHNHLREARARGYIDDVDCERLSGLAVRASIATMRLIRYLRSQRRF
jgi:four helix bundle protein